MTRKDLSFFVLIFALPAFFLSGTLTSSQTFFMRDLTYLFHPWRSLAAQFLQEGHFPLWNSYEMGGMPFLANGQSSILYPGTIFFYLWGFAKALKLFHWLHYSLAALGFFILGRRLGFGKPAALASGILFAYNGYTLTRLEFPSILGGLIWLPWSLLFILGIREGSKISRLCLALTWTFSFFSGFPQVFFMQMVLCAAFFLILKPGRRAAASFFCSFLLSLLLSAVQGLPMAELWRHSIRSGPGIELGEAGMYSLPIARLSALLSPWFLPVHKDQFTGEKFFWIWSAWWGLACTAVILPAFRRTGKRLFWFSIFFLILGLAASLGRELAGFEFMHRHIFLFRLFRYPPAALYWSVSAACFLLLLGLGSIKRSWLPAAALGLILLELHGYARQIQVTIPSDYYRFTFPNVGAIQEDAPGFALLSPKVSGTRRLPGVTSAHAAMKFRAFLFDLTNLPYRIKTLNSSGEPLALLSYQQLWKGFGGKSFDELRGALNRLNVTHFLTDETLEPGWSLISRDEDLSVFRNRQAMGEVFAASASEQEPSEPAISAPESARIENDRVRSVWDLKREAVFLTHVPIYPGWKLYCVEHGAHPVEPADVEPLQGFISARLLSGPHHLYLRYEPVYWKAALLLFLLALPAALALLFL